MSRESDVQDFIRLIQEAAGIAKKPFDMKTANHGTKLIVAGAVWHMPILCELNASLARQTLARLFGQRENWPPMLEAWYGEKYGIHKKVKPETRTAPSPAPVKAKKEQPVPKAMDARLIARRVAAQYAAEHPPPRDGFRRWAMGMASNSGGISHSYVHASVEAMVAAARGGTDDPVALLAAQLAGSPSIAIVETPAAQTAAPVVVASTLDVSKDTPHINGTVITLADGHRAGDVIIAADLIADGGETGNSPDAAPPDAGSLHAAAPIVEPVSLDAGLNAGAAATFVDGSPDNGLADAGLTDAKPAPAPVPDAQKIELPAAQGSDDSAAPFPESGLPVFKRLQESGFRNVADLVKSMNDHPIVVAKGGAFDVTLEQIEVALLGSDKAYGEERLNLNLLHHRILQTVNERRLQKAQGELSIKDLYGCRKELSETVLGRTRQLVHTNVLRALDNPKLRYIQTWDHLISVCDLEPGRLTKLLGEPQTAYADQDGRITPAVELTMLAKTLSCGHEFILTPAAWNALKTAMSPPKPAPAKPEPPVKPAQPLPPPKRDIAPAPAPAKTSAATTPRPAAGDKSELFQKAAVEVLKAYLKLGPASMTLLRRVEGINRGNKATPLEEVGNALRLDRSDAESLLEETKAGLIAVARAAGAELTNTSLVNGLRVFECDDERVTLMDWLEGQSDKEIGGRFSPALSEDKVRHIRENLLGRITASFTSSIVLEN